MAKKKKKKKKKKKNTQETRKMHRLNDDIISYDKKDKICQTGRNAQMRRLIKNLKILKQKRKGWGRRKDQIYQQTVRKHFFLIFQCTLVVLCLYK